MIPISCLNMLFFDRISYKVWMCFFIIHRESNIMTVIFLTFCLESFQYIIFKLSIAYIMTLQFKSVNKKYWNVLVLILLHWRPQRSADGAILCINIEYIDCDIPNFLIGIIFVTKFFGFNVVPLYVIIRSLYTLLTSKINNIFFKSTEECWRG